MLDRRIITLAQTNTISNLVSALLTQNFINPSNISRKIPELRVVNINLQNNPSVPVDFKNITALEALEKICEPDNIGFKIIFNPSNVTYDFYLYEGRQTQAVFSERFHNVLEQDYYHKTRDAKTTCVVDINGVATVVNDNITGQERKEMIITGNNNNSGSATQQGLQALADTAVIESFDTVINMGALQFAYGIDWDLGDIVTSESMKWNKALRQNILEVTEYYDKGGVHLTPVFGSYT